MGGKIYNNVCVNIVGDWAGLVMSENNEIYNNWTDTKSSVDIATSEYRLWPHPSNNFHDNYFHKPEKGDWPAGAKEIMEKAGLEPEYQSLKEAVDTELGKGYMPLTGIYMMPGKKIP